MPIHFTIENFHRVFNGFDQLFKGFHPQIRRIESEFLKQLSLVENLFDPLQHPHLYGPSARLYYHLPSESRITVLVPVGPANLSLNGSFPQFQVLIQKLFDNQVRQTRKTSMVELSPQKRLAEALIKSKQLVDQASTIIHSIKNALNEVQNRRNELLLKEPTAERIHQLERLDAIIEKLKSLTLPRELNAATIEAFSKTTNNILKEVRAEIDPNSFPAVNGKASENDKAALIQERQNAFEGVIENLLMLKSHLFRLGQYKEQLFKENLSQFTTLGELQQFLKSAQEQQGLIQQMQLEVLKLMDLRPPANSIHSTPVKLFQDEAHRLIAKQEKILASLREEPKHPQKTVPQERVPVPVQAPPNEPVNQPPFSIQTQPQEKPLISPPAQTTDPSQTRSDLIAEQKEKFRTDINTLLAYVDEPLLPRANQLKKMAEELIKARELLWNQLNEKSQSTVQEEAQWQDRFNTLKAIDDLLLSQLVQTLQNGNPSGHIPQAHHLMAQIGACGTAFFKAPIKELNQECLELKRTFASFQKTPKLTFEQLKAFIDRSHAVISQWLIEDPINQEAVPLWKQTHEQLVSLLGAVYAFLLADNQENAAYITTLEKEQEQFLQFNDLYIIERYESFINQMKSVAPFDFATDPLNTLDQYVNRWNKQFVIIEKERLSFNDLMAAEYAYAKCVEFAKKQITHWQESYQQPLATALQQLLNQIQGQINQNKTFLKKSNQIEGVIHSLDDAKEMIEGWINEADEIPLGDLIEAHRVSNPILAQDILRAFQKKVNETIELFKQSLTSIKTNVAHEISDLKANLARMEADPSHPKYKELSKRMTFLQDLTDVIDHHGKLLTNFTQSKDVQKMTSVQLQAYDDEVRKLIEGAKQEIMDFNEQKAAL